MYDTNSLEAHWMPFTANREFKADPHLVVQSSGMYMTDHLGRQVIDGCSSLFCTPLGHGRREIAEAVYKQLSDNDACCPFQLGHPGSFDMAHRLSRILPEPINHVFFTNSGSESVDTAMKIVMAYHRAHGESHRIRFVSRERAYHGVNMGGVSLAGLPKNRQNFPVTLPNVVMMRHTWSGEELNTPDQPEHGAVLAEDLQRFCDLYGGSTIAAVFVEPVAGSTGCLPPPKGYLERLRQICDQHGILLVFDEVITGFGRTGPAFAAERFGVTPDIMTMAKALTNGVVPMGAVAVKDEIYDTITSDAADGAIELFHGYTYSGSPAACAAGVATLKIYEEEGMFERGASLSGYFQDAVHSLGDHPLVQDVRSIGLFAGVDVHPSKTLGIQKHMFANGLHLKFTGDCGLLAPAFIAERGHVDEMVGKFRKSLDVLAA